MSRSSMTVDLHVLQSVPSNALNRDDAGQPKTMFFGGVERPRVSSQAWKRAMRAELSELLPESELSALTKRVPERVGQSIVKLVPDLDEGRAKELAEGVVGLAGLKVVDDKNGSGDNPYRVLQAGIYISNAQADALAEVAKTSHVEGLPLDGKYDKGHPKLARFKELRASAKRVLRDHHGVELALFGRMVADQNLYKVESAVRVAHALGVYPVVREQDYFTAVDDLRRGDEQGAIMIGTTGYNSSILYRYASVNVQHLKENLGGSAADAPVAVAAFAQAFAESMPAGKQNSFAVQTPPSAVLAVVRKGRGLSLANAFLDVGSLQARGDNQLAVATQALVEHYEDVNSSFGDNVVGAHVVRLGKDTAALDAVSKPVSLKAMVKSLAAAARKAS